ncbi:uncharacterized protein N7529_006572 [Penicillium soppii]|uniref:uncharacterized protein n=1 Tax=Penicillium soppii TaxID=69789 RepID=UPI0025472988|nr:uncharacterized protein N7529_006572 [Penicillium soppii]KAJ5864656.1 hypothetical protein N7529_006572 [Penicillium soppii]
MSNIDKLFSPTTRITDKLEDVLPASFRDDNLLFHAPLDDISKFLELDLSVQRLNDIQEYLWLAGRPMPPRPLNYQISVSRQIILDEKVDMHLIWGPGRRIHIKPLPQYLLDSRFWSTQLLCNENISGCYCCHSENNGSLNTSFTHQLNQTNTESETNTKTNTKTNTNIPCPCSTLSQSALGFLNSYIALIQYPSDFLIAKQHSLLPDTLTWPQWSALVQNLLKNDVICLDKINPRYRYGELRLSRLNKIYFCVRGSFIRGYRPKYQTFQELFHAYLTPITAMTVYIALVLTAMQVGLGTERLQSSQAFQNASYGFTVFSILGPLLLVFVVVGIAGVQLGANALATIVFRRERYGFFKKRLRRG